MSKEPKYGTGYNGDAAERERIVSLAHTHRANDQIVQGVGWDGFRGCFIGCTLECYDRPKWSNAIGGPPQLPYLAESIFEGLPEREAPDFHVEFLEAITCGANLDNVWHDFAEWLLVDEQHGAKQRAHEKGGPTIQAVADLHRRRLGDAASWENARVAAAAYRSHAARSHAAEDAAFASHAAEDAAAARSHAAAAAAASYAVSRSHGAAASYAVSRSHGDAAYAAAAAAEDVASVASAAYAVSTGEAFAAAREAHRQAQRDKLIELVRGCEKAQ